MTRKNDIYHHDNVFPITMGRETRLEEVLAKLSKDEELLLFDGEEFIEIAEVLKNREEWAEEFLDLSVKYDEFGIYDFYVESDHPLFSFARECPKCGNKVVVISKDSSKGKAFCDCC